MQHIIDNPIMFDHWLANNVNCDLADIIRQFAITSKIISDKIARAPIEHLYGSTSITNYHNEEVKTLDMIANNQFIINLKKSQFIYAIISEENYSVIETGNSSGKYFVTMDPLDGSSNIDANVNIGTIFGIYPMNGESNYLLPAKEMIASGYVLYGSSTMLILSLNGQVNGFCLNTSFGEFILTHPDMKIPNERNIYSVNEGNYELWNEQMANMIDYIKSIDKPNGKSQYSQRYIGSMVADIHRTILYGGLFMYPGTVAGPNGKLRYLYEVGPMSHIITNAGGYSLINGTTEALNYIPDSIHQCVPIFMGSRKNMEIVTKFIH